MGTQLFRLVLLLLLTPLFGVSAGEPSLTRAVFRGPVLKVGPLHGYTGPCILVHRNPRFFLKIRVEGGPAAPLEWKDGDIVVLGVNSLDALFVDEPKIGATYTFSVACARQGHRLTFDDLRIESRGPG